MTRGERNNNPGNIDFNPRNNWKGQVGIEDAPASGKARFAKFDSPENGIRALAVLLINYQRKGFNTINKIVSRYAPSHENKTDKYAENVSRWTGIPEDKVLQPDDLFPLVTAMIRQECGFIPYHTRIIAEGIRRAILV
jgi:hypothetical protein